MGDPLIHANAAPIFERGGPAALPTPPAYPACATLPLMRFALLAATMAVPMLLLAGCSSTSTTASPTRAAAAASSAASSTSTSGLQTRDVTVSSGTTTARLRVELAATEAERERGLMERTALDDSSGMLFLFANDSTTPFWMKDTLIPLDIAFIDAAGKVIGIVHGKPLDETVLPPPGPYRYALEVADGWFARKGLGAGATVTLPPNLPPAK